MKCLRCEQDNPPQARFCMGCGAGLSQRCGKCGTDLPAEARFCFSCGQSLSTAAPLQPAPVAGYTPKHLADKILKDRSALEGERRQVSVLFADIAGFTSLAEQLDPEDVHRIINRCFEIVSEEVHRFEGTINQYTGDGVMALFGAPIAHEDGPRRAVHAALAIQRALRDYGKDVRERTGRAFEMRIGINTGPVVVGRIGDDLRMDYTAVGDTTNLAARLQQAARPGAVVVSEATQRLVSGYFETLDLGELAVKGHAPVRGWEVLRPRGRRARLDLAVERGLTPLVGRARELATLRELFGRVKANHGQVVMLAADAGVGKSRLVLEFRRALADAGEAVTWLEGRCISFGQSIPFLPLIDQLRQNFGVEEFDGEPEIIAKVEHGMRRMGEIDAHIPYIRYLLSVDPGDPAVTAMDAAARRKRVFDAVLALSRRGAARRPIVFVFEDLHWIDATSQEYLGAFFDTVATAPIMVIATHRHGYTAPFGSRSFQTTVTLDPLAEDEALAMAAGVLGTADFPDDVKRTLLSKAEGVPLFVEEVAKTLLDVGVLRRDNGGGYRMVKGLAEVSVPETIQGIIMARLDRLGEDGKRTVQLASVIGREFMRRLLERIADVTGELEGLLRELKALEIIYEKGLLPEPAYVFKHAVIQDVAYESLLVQRRKELHRAVGRAIEELYADRLAEHYGGLAHHFFRGEEWDTALRYGVLAGDAAAHAFANAEARREYARAVDAAGRLATPLDAVARARLHQKHAGALMTLGDFAECEAEFLRALELIRRAGDRQQEADLLFALSTVGTIAHTPRPAIRYLDEALAIVNDLDEPGLHAAYSAQRALVRSAGLGRLREAAPDVDAALLGLEAVRDPRRLTQALVSLGSVRQWRGELDPGLGLLRKGIAMAEQHSMGFHYGWALFFTGSALGSKGEYDEALATYRRLSDYAHAAGDKTFIARAPNGFGGVYLDAFDADNAIRYCLEGDETARRVWPWPEPRGHSLVKLALAHMLKGAYSDADDCLDRATALLEVDEWLRWRWQIALLRARGELALAKGEIEAASEWAAQALDLARHTDSRKHVARAQHLQGEVLAAGGRLPEAAAVLRESIALAESLGTPREIWMGRAALGNVLGRLGQDREAEAALTTAADTLQAIAAKITTPGLRGSFLNGPPVVAVYRALGHRPPGDGAAVP